MRRLKVPVILLCMAALLSCSRCKSDADRASDERAEMKKKFESAVALVPYRIFKLMVRARGEPNEPESAKKLWVLLEKTRETPEAVKTAEDAAKVAEVYLDLVKGMYLARKTLNEHDEDEFPLVWTKWTKARPPPLIGYDAPMEHLSFGVVWWIIQMADKSQKAPAPEIIHYELSRAEPQPGWPWGFKTLTLWIRGASFCTNGYHFAADEELTKYLGLIDRAPEKEITELGVYGRPGTETIEEMRAAGYFMRAFNRTKMKRDEKATDDLESGLKALEKIGVENELTWWAWSFVHTRRKRYPEAAANLDKLAASPHITKAERAEIALLAKELRTTKSFPVYAEAKAMSLVIRALIARAGGIDHILTTIVGAETANEILGPFKWANRVKTGLTEVSFDSAGEIAKDAASGTKALTKRGLELFKQVVAKDAGE